MSWSRKSKILLIMRNHLAKNSSSLRLSKTCFRFARHRNVSECKTNARRQLWYSHINWWRGVPKGLKREDSSVSCAYEKNHRADECLAGILPQPGVQGKRANRARHDRQPWAQATPVPVQDLRKDVQREGGDAVCWVAQA